VVGRALEICKSIILDKLFRVVKKQDTQGNCSCQQNKESEKKKDTLEGNQMRKFPGQSHKLRW
jgi:hypothetical protein